MKSTIGVHISLLKETWEGKARCPIARAERAALVDHDLHVPCPASFGSPEQSRVSCLAPRRDKIFYSPTLPYTGWTTYPPQDTTRVHSARGPVWVSAVRLRRTRVSEIASIFHAYLSSSDSLFARARLQAVWARRAGRSRGRRPAGVDP